MRTRSPSTGRGRTPREEEEDEQLAEEVSINEEDNLNLGPSISAETNRRDEAEEAKAKVLAEEQNRKTDSKTSFAITNTAVNSVQPNRWSPPNRKRPANERAGDDYYYKKFKKMKALEIRRPPLPLERSAANRKRPLSEKTEDDYDKLKKISEEAKAKVLAEEENKKKDRKTSFVITNTAVNYVQPNRWSPPNRKRPANERAADDYYYKKFKNMNGQETRRPPLPLEQSAANRKRPLSEKTTDDYDKFKKICRRYANIKNTTSTEEAKAKVLAEEENKKKDRKTSFVHTNMAVNYVQPNRWSPPNRKRPANERAGDDYYYKKFKKMKALEIRRPPLPLERSAANRKRPLSEKTEDDYDKLKKICRQY
ncbi:splicing factor C9orf78 homolog [Gavia stellata]|uniref:splicing factor C9orf78 homolog n=1 Tax=Gavia stellata TaxID=37040 RepID=UPI00289C5BD0|nr:splicing factor C9orf78 homolog [Gavia stellata]